MNKIKHYPLFRERNSHSRKHFVVSHVGVRGIEAGDEGSHGVGLRHLHGLGGWGDDRGVVVDVVHRHVHLGLVTICRLGPLYLHVEHQGLAETHCLKVDQLGNGGKCLCFICQNLPFSYLIEVDYATKRIVNVRSTIDIENHMIFYICSSIHNTINALECRFYNPQNLLLVFQNE